MGSSVGASKRGMERVRDEALEPIRKTIAKRQEREMRQVLLQSVSSRYKFARLSHEQQQNALSEIREALNRLPPGTAKATLEEAIDKVIEHHYRIHENEAAEEQKRRHAELKADQYLGHIEEYLEREYEFDSYFEILQEAKRLHEPIRQALVEELLGDPEIDADDLQGRIEELVDGEF
jgi:hypothetical protein